jgi:hypothetical protein
VRFTRLLHEHGRVCGTGHTMEKRALGKSGLEVCALGLGCLAALERRSRPSAMRSPTCGP